MSFELRVVEYHAPRFVAEQRALLRRVDSLPILDSRLEDEILGYDEQGMPS